MKIHILAVCGAMTTPLALELVKQGHQVTGSDQDKIYPPFSGQLAQAKISINQTTIDKNIDLYIVGSAYKNHPRCLSEFQEITKQKLKYISATEYLAQNIVKENSILITGSFGKTTITGLLVKIISDLNLNPNYFVGGQMVGQEFSLQTSSSTWSVIEADESINGLDTKAKFLYYTAKYVILTSTSWEHRDSYKSEKENLNSYINLLKNIPQNGLLVYNPQDVNIKKILPYCRGKTIPYKTFHLKNRLIGEYNQQNINAAVTLCHALSFNQTLVQKSISEFSGIKRRLEIIKKTANNIFIDDFAQSPERVGATLTAVHQTFPQYQIKVFFEPHASFLQHKSSLAGFSQAFKNATEIIIGKIKFSNNLNKLERTTFKDYINEIHNKCTYIPINNQVVSYLITKLKPHEVLIHFSSGGLEGLDTFNKVISYFK